jgi:hypothetical protein
MIGFALRRYGHGLVTRRLWFLAALAPPLVYVLVSAASVDQITVRQDVAIAPDAPIALSTSPVDFTRMGDVIAKPAEFFLDRFAIRELHGQLELNAGAGDRAMGPFSQTVERTMSLTVPSNDTVRIAYRGGDGKLGEALVAYYAGRLVRKAEEGQRRSRWKQQQGPGQPKPAAARLDAPTASDAAGARQDGMAAALKGPLQMEQLRSVWRPGRLPTVLMLLISSAAIILIWLGVLEWTDPSFKSERQVARYLQAPILGSLPHLDRLSLTLKGGSGA